MKSHPTLSSDVVRPVTTRPRLRLCPGGATDEEARDRQERTADRLRDVDRVSAGGAGLHPGLLGQHRRVRGAPA